MHSHRAHPGRSADYKLADSAFQKQWLSLIRRRSLPLPLSHVLQCAGELRGLRSSDVGLKACRTDADRPQ
jgi:hypothetical protein